MTDVNGVGIGLRMDVAGELLDRQPEEVAWLEVHPENYMHRGGRYPTTLKKAMERWPVATHGLTMCFGAVTPYDAEYLATLRAFLRDVGSPWHSDHMCFGGVDGVFLHDLMPLPFNEESARTIEQRYREAQEALDVPSLAIENVSYYAPSAADETDEVGFVTEVLERADAKILLDVNNVYVNSRNHGFDPKPWIDRIPADRVVQIHVAGHLIKSDDLRIDTHGESVCDDVYDLLDYTLRRIGPTPVLLERDTNIPPLSEILLEVRRLNEIYERATAAFGETEKSAEAGEVAPC
jgi:uncharacterized protein (UPF0276 family)